MAADRPGPSRPPVATQGFTLVELLVSLAVLAMTATLLLAAMTTGRGIDQRASASALAGESVAAAQALLRARLETMAPETFLLGVTPTTDVRGDPTGMAFTADAIGRQQPMPPQRYRLLLTRAGELSLFSADPLSARADQANRDFRGWERAVLLGNVRSLEIAYYGAAPPDNQRRWRGSWSDLPVLPELVRVRVGFAPGDRRIWPDLIARPAATVNALCVVDSVTGRCSFGRQ